MTRIRTRPTKLLYEFCLSGYALAFVRGLLNKAVDTSARGDRAWSAPAQNTICKLTDTTLQTWIVLQTECSVRKAKGRSRFLIFKIRVQGELLGPSCYVNVQVWPSGASTSMRKVNSLPPHTLNAKGPLLAFLSSSI